MILSYLSAMKRYLASPDGNKTIGVQGRKMGDKLLSEGWTEAQGQQAPKRQREARRKSYYYTDSSHRG